MRILSAGSSWGDFASGLSTQQKEIMVNRSKMTFDFIFSGAIITKGINKKALPLDGKLSF